MAEPLATGHLDILVNHGYLAVDFFFLLSGFVIGYAYDEKWNKMTLGSFLKRRFQHLQPMVVLRMTLGAISNSILQILPYGHSYTLYLSGRCC